MGIPRALWFSSHNQIWSDYAKLFSAKKVVFRRNSSKLVIVHIRRTCHILLLTKMWGLWDEKLLRLVQRSLNYAKLYYYYPSGTFRIQFTQPIEYSNTFLQYYFGLGNLRQGLCTLLVWTQFLEWKFVNSLKVKIFLSSLVSIWNRKCNQVE